ncbi:glycosyltransferase [Lithospermum erythrorhizon]|uniref:Glycosyltransferase n=1 Tax=Lithospermum erythrorhizon TaxID=34254 RepID=A0AAV3QPM3_LITER
MLRSTNAINGYVNETRMSNPTNVNNGLVNSHTNLHDNGHGLANGHVNVLAKSNNNNTQDQNTLRILMFPWLAHGHISPFLELAKKLANTKNFIVYLCSTPVNLISVKKKLEGVNNSSSIILVELHLEETTALPSCYHTTNGLPPHLMTNLIQALTNSIPNFKNILDGLKPDLLIYDSLQPWAADAALERHIPAVDFITSSTVMTSFCYHMYKNPQGKGNDFPFIDTIHFRSYEKHHLENIIARSENTTKEWSCIECINKSSDIVLIKGMKEIEGKYCDYLSKMCGKKIMLVGPLVQEPNQDDENSFIIKWLNGKNEKSTIFVSFGSEYFLTDEQREEIAHGLELTKVNFVWVVRFPKDSKGGKINLEDSLPKGFLTSIGDRGLVLDSWAPQAKILEHPSIGGFVSHCGWSSIMESMKYGVPIIAIPMHLDQPINSRLVEEVGVGVEVVRSDNGKLLKNKLVELIDKVVIKEEGKFVREKAKNMSENIALNGDIEMDEVVKEIVRVCDMMKEASKKNGF